MSDRWTIHHGNCLDPITGLATLGDKSVDHFLLDPPYEDEAHTKGRRCKRGWGIDEEPLTFDPITEEERDAAARQFARVARRWILVFCQMEAAHKWRASLEAAGAKYKRTGIWYKPDGQPQLSGDRPGVGYETIVIAHAAVKGKSRWNGGGSTAVWTYPKYDAVRYGHQTQKPISLMSALVADFTDFGDLICDPFAGSGTTGVAAVRAGRRFLGWELQEKYADVARRRIGETKEQTALPFARAPKATQGALALEQEETP